MVIAHLWELSCIYANIGAVNQRILLSVGEKPCIYSFIYFSFFGTISENMETKTMVICSIAVFFAFMDLVLTDDTSLGKSKFSEFLGKNDQKLIFNVV